jgi:hypothetical protein
MNKKYPTFFFTWFNKFTRVPYPGPKAFTYEKSDPRYNLIVICNV